ncbi:hypothetical protein ACHWQZ_G017043 [Mnemiopsis leidyi]
MAKTWKLCLLWIFLQLKTQPTQSVKIYNYNNIVDGNLSTYATIRFDPSDNPEGVIEVKLAGLMNVTIIEINHNHRSFLDFRVYVESTYCGTCEMSYECNIYCIYPVTGKKIFLKKYLQFNDLYSLLEIFETQETEESTENILFGTNCRIVREGRDLDGLRFNIYTLIIYVREEGHTTQEEQPGHAPSTGVGGATELRQAVWEEPPPPTAPEIMDLPPPSYGRSILDENPNYDDIPSYDEVISNYAAFPGAKPNTIDSSV